MQSANPSYKRLFTINETQHMELKLLQNQLNESKSQLITTK